MESVNNTQPEPGRGQGDGKAATRSEKPRRRLNLKLIFGALAVLGVVFVGTAALWWFAIHRNPGRYASRGDASAAKGDYKAAIQSYGRALYFMRRSDSRRGPVLMKLADAFGKFPAKTIYEAYFSFQNIISTLDQVTDASPKDKEAFTRLLNYYYQTARETGTDLAWEKLRNKAQVLAAKNPDDPLVLKYHGIAQLVWVSKGKASEKERTRAHDALQTAIRLQPKDADLSFYLAAWHMNEARVLSSEGQGEKAAAMRSEARKVATDFAAQHPDVPEARLNQIRVLADIGNSANDKESTAQALAVANAMEKDLLVGDSPAVTRELAVYLRIADRDLVDLPNGRKSLRGIERSATLLKHILNKHPANLDALLELGALYRITGRFDEAEALFAKASEDRPAAVGPTVIKERNIQLVASYELINLKLTRREASTDPQAQEALLKDARAKFVEFKKMAVNSPAAEFIEGRLAQADGDLWKAVTKLDVAINNMDRKNPEASLQCGKVLAQLGQTGAAMKRLESVLTQAESPPDQRVKAATEMAQILIRLRQFNDARQILQSLIKAIPDDKDVRLLMATSMLEESRVLAVVSPQDASTYMTEARNVLEPLLAKGDAQALRQLADIYLMSGNQVKAHDTLAEYVQKNPADQASLRNLVAIERNLGSTDAAVERVRKAIQGLPDNPALRMLRATLEKRDEYWQVMPDLFALALQKDDFQRNMGMVGFYIMLGKRDDALKALDDAEKIKPDDKSVLFLRFDKAVQEQNWDEAQRVLVRMEKSKLDPAEVHLRKGQLALLRNQSFEAVSGFSAVVQLRPLFSEAWALLGNAHRLGGDLGNASSDYQKALEVKPDNIMALRGMFYLNDSWQQYPKALDYLRLCIRCDPRNDELFYTYLNYLSAYGDKQEAIRLRKTLAEKQPANEDNRRGLAQLLLQVNQQAAAKEELTSLLKKNPDNRDNIGAMAFFHLVANQPDDGRKLIQDYLDRRSGKATVEDWLLLSRYLRQIGDKTGTRAAFDKAVAVQDPKTMPASLELAGWLLQMSELAESLKAYREVRDGTQAVQVWPVILDLLMRLNNLEEAEKELAGWKAAVSWNSPQAVTESLLLNARGRAAEADRVITDALKKEPKNAGLYLVRAQIHFGDNSESLQAVVKGDLEKALDLNPALVRARELLADWYLNRNRLEEAADNLRKLILARSDFPPYRTQLARVLARQEKNEDLVRLLDESIARIPELPVWYQLKAAYLKQERRLAEAVKALAKACELSPTLENVTVYAEALLDTNAPEPALAILDKYPNYVSGSPILLAIHVRALVGVQKGFSASAEFTKALDLTGASYNDLEQVVGQITKVTPAAEVLKMLEAQQKDKKSVVIQLMLAKVYLDQQDYDRALPLLETLREQVPPADPLLVNVLWYAGASYYNTRQFLKARGAYEALLRLQPSHGAALNNLSYLLAEDLKKPEDALPLAEKAATFWQATDTERANVLDTLGRVQYLAGKLVDAELTLQRSIQLKSLPVNRLHMAEVMAGRNRFTEARAELQVARQLALPRGDKDLLARIEHLAEAVDQKLAPKSLVPPPTSSMGGKLPKP